MLRRSAIALLAMTSMLAGAPAGAASLPHQDGENAQGGKMAPPRAARERVREMLRDDFTALNDGRLTLGKLGEKVCSLADTAEPDVADVLLAGVVRIYSRAGETNGASRAAERLDVLRRPFVTDGNAATLRLGRYGEIAFVRCPAGPVELVLDASGRKTADVTVSRPYWIMKYPIVRRASAFYPPLDPIPGTVSEKTMRDYVCLNRSMATGLARHFTERFRGKLPPGYVFRLATLAEWERAFHADAKDASDPFFDLRHVHRNDAVDRSVYYDYDRLEPQRKKLVNLWGIGDWCRHEKVWDTFDARTLGTKTKDLSGFHLVDELPPPPASVDPHWTCSGSNAVSILRQPSWVRWKASPPDFGQDWSPARFVIAPELK